MMKMIMHVFAFYLSFIYLHARSVRLIPNAVLLSSSVSIVLTNLSRDQCLCQTSTNTYAFNYFTDGICQLFNAIPCSYEVKINLQSRIYLLDPSFDPLQPGCSINGTELIRRLNNSVSNSIVANSPRCLLIDDRGYLVALLLTPPALERYDPSTLVRIDRMNITGSSTVMSLSHFNGTYFVGLSSNNITVIDGTTLTVVNFISSPYLVTPRDMIFLDNGQTMIVASSTNDYLIFFNRSTSNSRSYSYYYRIPLPYRFPYGMWRVNDTFFYVTSYGNKTIYSYSAVNSTSWSENLVIDARAIATISSGSGYHVTIDVCGRFWFSIDYGGALIYDRNGVFIGQLPPPYTRCFDMVITKNFTIYFSTASANQIIRLQPDLSC